MLKRIFTAVITLLISNQGLTAGGSDINGLIERFKAKTKCESVSAVVYDHGELYFYGDSEGLYQIGSMTKSFTGLAVQKLIGEGKINCRDKISDLIPGFTVYYGSDPVDITVEDLMRQQSGFTNSENDYPSASKDMSLSEWAGSISGKELKSMPGTEYSYSNVNYNLLGLLIENVTGRAYREYMEEEILKPMGLESVTVGMPDEGRIIEGTRLGFRNVFKFETDVREGSIPAGYFYSNTEDIGMWIRNWIESDRSDIEGVISHLEKKGEYYGGWERFEGDMIGHSGGTPNYSSRIVFSRSEKIGVCVLTNLNVAATTDSLCNIIFSELTGNSHGELQCDVWTVFDIIFTAVSVAGTVILIFVMCTGKKRILTVIGATLTVLFILMLILFPLIFGAGLKEIALMWAPWSFTSGFLILLAGALGAGIKLCVVKANEGRTKTG